MNAHNKTISDFRLKITGLFFLKFVLGIAAVWLFAWGTAVLVLRVATSVPRMWLLWGLAGLGPVLCLAALMARRRAPTASAVRALLDGQNRCGGLLIASESTDIGHWRQQMPRVSIPAMRWRGRKVWALLGAGIVFVLVGFAVPQSFASPQSNHVLEIGKEIDRLSMQIETLREEEIIDVEKAQALEDKLDQIEANASGEGPAKTWEALDHMEGQAAKIADEAAEEAMSRTEKLTKAQALTKGLIKDADKMDGETATAVMKELAEMVKQASQDNSALKEHLPQELQNACRNGSLTPEQMQQLAEALEECGNQIGEMLEDLSECGLVDAQIVHLNEQLGDFDCDGLADFLDDNCGCMSVAELVSVWCKNRPGRGGINRGRGDAPMTWTDGTDSQGSKFQEKTLPAASLAALKDSKLMGVSVATPKVGKTGPDGQSGMMKTAAAGSGEAHTHIILPRHRGAVRKYFKRKDE